MLETTGNNQVLFNSVRAIVDARIAARREAEARKRVQRVSESFSCCCESIAPPESANGATRLSRARISFKSKHIGGMALNLRSHRAKKECLRPIGRRFPVDLPVPSPEPRPPNLTAPCLSFAARVVIAVRDKFQGDAPRVYAAAKVTRQAYSQIISDETHSVSKRTAIRFAFALHCDKDEARQLLKSAGYAFSNTLTEDFILQACLEVAPPIWDLDSVNELLREYRVDFQY